MRIRFSCLTTFISRILVTITSYKVNCVAGPVAIVLSRFLCVPQVVMVGSVVAMVGMSMLTPPPSTPPLSSSSGSSSSSSRYTTLCCRSSSHHAEADFQCMPSDDGGVGSGHGGNDPGNTTTITTTTIFIIRIILIFITVYNPLLQAQWRRHATPYVQYMPRGHGVVGRDRNRHGPANTTTITTVISIIRIILIIISTLYAVVLNVQWQCHAEPDTPGNAR